MNTCYKARFSNFELLRILSMTMVILWHFIVRTIIDVPNGAQITLEQCSFVGYSTVILPCSFLCVAVNIFVLISGYWGINLSFQSVLKLYLLCLFYNLLSFGVSVADTEMSIKLLLKCFFVTKTENWFFPAYFWLMFFAPICNLFMNNARGG